MNCYYGWNTDDRILRESSSGGIFTALAEYVFARGGVVFGAGTDPETWTVKHRTARTEAELGALRGSKYAQSDMADVYRETGELLKAGTPMLFAGTPCQAAALRRYLEIKGIGQEKLLCAEVLCLGVTSAKTVQSYIKSKEKQKGSQIKNLQFRTKDRPWYQGSCMKIEYENGKTEVKDNLIDPFYIAYVNSLILRPSCYACPFAKKEGREADLTIGDYWGAENEITDRERLNKGIGLVLVNTGKGEEVWQEITGKGAVEAYPLDWGKAVKRNGALSGPTKKNGNRGAFFQQIAEGEDFRKAVYGIYRKKARKNWVKYLIGYENMRRMKKNS